MDKPEHWYYTGAVNDKVTAIVFLSIFMFDQLETINKKRVLTLVTL